MKYIYLLKIVIVIWLSVSKGYAQTSTVTLTSEKQLIRGFGGINHPIWAGDLTADQRNTAFGNGSGQMGMSVLRIWVSDKPNEWARELPTAKRAIELGAIVFASPWNPPSNMVETFTRGTQTDAKRLRYDMYDEYAQHLNDFVTYMKNNGVDLYAISVQNEPDYAHDWTWWTPQEMLRFMKENAGSINCRVIAPESFQYLKNMSDPILNDPQALANMDILGTHLYGTSYNNFPYPLFKQKGAGKELWMTEVYYPNSNTNSADLWPEALEVGYHIYNAMVEAEFQAYVWWYIRRQYSPMKEDGTISKRGYCMSHYSKFVRPGYVRVDATKNPATDVYVSAYKKGDDVVMVIVNRGTSSKTITLSVPGTKVTSLEKYVTSASKSLSKEANVNSTTGSFQITLDAQSITTFAGKAVPGTPVVSITSPVNNATFSAPATISLAATASDPDGVISKVEFYSGTTRFGEDATAPYTFSWTNVAAGTYTITAVASDNSGNKTTSQAVTVKVNAPQGPYNGTVHLIPGTIQAEAFDVGGNGFAYLDNTPGSETGVNFRTDEDVDIETCTDAGGGYNIGWATAGEWLEYTVNVQTTGTYNMDLRVACNGDVRTLSVNMDGTTIAGNVAIPNTAGWQTWQTVSVNNIPLTSGQKVMRITVGATDYININYVSYTLVQPPVASITAAGPVTFCAGGSVALNAGTGAGYTYQWKRDGNVIANATSSSYTASQSGSYTVTVSANGQAATSAAVVVTANAIPGAPVVVSPVTYCQNANAVQLTATGANLRWYTVPTNGTSSAIAPVPSTAMAGTTNYFVSQTTNGCESARALIAVTVNAVPNTPAVSSPVTYCQNANAVQLTATGANLRWYTVPTNGTSSAIAPVPSTAVEGTTNYFVSQTTNGCESARALIAVAVNAVPAAVITPSGPVTFVEGGSVMLNANTGTGLSYQWFNGTTQVGTGASYVATATGNYTVEVTNESGCKATSSELSVTSNRNQPSVITIVSPAPDATVSGPMTITVTVSDPDGGITKVEYLDGTTVIGTSSEPPYSFTWDNPTAGEHVITVRVTDSNGGVTTSSSVTVTSAVSTGIRGVAEMKGIVYPNPASGEMTIETSMDLTGAKVTAIDVLGEEIRLQPRVHGKGATFDVSGLTEGTYLLIVRQENAVLMTKITVLR